MTTPSFSAQYLARLKKQAKLIAKQQGLQHSHALDLVAKQQGYGNWSQLGRGAPKKPPTKRAMLKWFEARHTPAVGRSPYDGREGGYLYPTVDIWETLEKAFPDADWDDLNAVASDLDLEGPYLDPAFLKALDDDWLNDPLNRDEPPQATSPVEQAKDWLPPLKKGRYASAEILGVDGQRKTIKVACVRLRRREYVKNEPHILCFRCPVCTKVHTHGGGFGGFGTGCGTRVPHCNLPLGQKNFEFDLVEVHDASRAGHIPKELLARLQKP